MAQNEHREFSHEPVRRVIGATLGKLFGRHRKDKHDNEQKAACDPSMTEAASTPSSPAHGATVSNGTAPAAMQAQVADTTRPSSLPESMTVSAAQPSLEEGLAALSLAPTADDPDATHGNAAPPESPPGVHSDEASSTQPLAAADAQMKPAVQPGIETGLGLQVVADLIAAGHAKNIVFACGAGISVNAGIPDFRTPGTGLYSQLAKYNLPYPEAVFDISYFRNISAMPFYKLGKELFAASHKPTATHYFMRLLHEKRLLLRVFTQNIDSLESVAGLPKDMIVAAHGNCDGARCIECKHEARMDDVCAAMHAEEPLTCKRCKRGLVKPDIVFYGEELPARFGECLHKDMPRCDLLIVMGTSLAVYPFAGIVGMAGEAVPRVLINREIVKDGSPGFFKFGQRDAVHLGDSDDAVQQLACMLGWEKDLQKLMSSSAL